MKNPAELKFSKSHEWLHYIDETTVEIGLTDYAQDALGDLVFVNLPEEGDGAVKGETIADVESVKAVSDVYSPVTGVVSSINEDVIDSPESINKTPYEAWLFRVSDITDAEDLLTYEEYVQFCKEEA